MKRAFAVVLVLVVYAIDGGAGPLSIVFVAALATLAAVAARRPLRRR